MWCLWPPDDSVSFRLLWPLLPWCPEWPDPDDSVSFSLPWPLCLWLFSWSEPSAGSDPLSELPLCPECWCEFVTFFWSFLANDEYLVVAFDVVAEPFKLTRAVSFKLRNVPVQINTKHLERVIWASYFNTKSIYLALLLHMQFLEKNSFFW